MTNEQYMRIKMGPKMSYTLNYQANSEETSYGINPKISNKRTTDHVKS